MRDKVKQLFELINMKQEILYTMDAILDMAVKTLVIEGRGGADLDDLIARYKAMVEVRSDQLMEEIVDVYADFYNEADLDVLITFNSSDTCKKVLDNSMAISKRITEIGGDFGQRIVKELNLNKDTKPN